MHFWASVARQRSLGHLASAELFLSERSESRPQKQAMWQGDKGGGAEIVADNKRRYFIKGDDRNWGSKCADSPPKRQNERSFVVHHLLKGEVSWLFVIRSPGWAGRKISEALQISQSSGGERCNLTVTVRKYWNTGCSVLVWSQCKVQRKEEMCCCQFCMYV